MVESTWNGGGADLTPFYEKGIPGLYFVSKYSYDYLHQPSDTPETLNPKLYEKIVKLVYLTAKEVADVNYNREMVLKKERQTQSAQGSKSHHFSNNIFFVSTKFPACSL